MLAGAAMLVALGGAGEPNQLQLDCYKVKADVVACRVSQASDAPVPGAVITLYDRQHRQLGRGQPDLRGVYVFKAPPEDYVVVATSKGTQLATLSSADLGEAPHRPGWGGDWVPAAAVDRLQAMQSWRDQFLAEKGPLIQRTEDELAK